MQNRLIKSASLNNQQIVTGSNRVFVNLVCSAMVVASSPAAFYTLGLSLVGGKAPATVNSGIERFKDHFKVHPRRCSQLFAMIRGRLSPDFRPKHLLWTLYFLLSYDCERRLARVLGTNRTTLRKYLWPTILAIAGLCDTVVSCLLLLQCDVVNLFNFIGPNCIFSDQL